MQIKAALLHILLQGATVMATLSDVTSTYSATYQLVKSVEVCVMTAETTAWALSVSCVSHTTTRTLCVLQMILMAVYVSLFKA